MHRTAPAGRQHKKRAFSLLTLLYVAMIVYGSLYPFSGWRAAIEPRFSFLTDPFPYHISDADVLTNVLAYLPLGILLVWTLETRSRMLSLMCAVLLGGVLSFTMESVQMFLPSRVSSNIDLLTNLAGTLIGAAVGLAFHPKSELNLRLTSIRDEWFLPGPGSGVVIATFAVVDPISAKSFRSFNGCVEYCARIRTNMATTVSVLPIEGRVVCHERCGHRPDDGGSRTVGAENQVSFCVLRDAGASAEAFHRYPTTVSGGSFRISFGRFAVVTSA